MRNSDVAAAIADRLPERSGWSVKASQNELQHWTVVLDHPASHGLILETPIADGPDAVRYVTNLLVGSDEIAVAAAAPGLEHADLVLGLRTLADMFSWSNDEVRAVAFLIFEHGHLTEPETAWVSGFVGLEAPRRAQSPLG